MRVVTLGGNGHCSARWDLVRARLASTPTPPFALMDVPYPGFEDRPPAPHFEGFLEIVGDAIQARADRSTLVYASGIGGLVLLCLRAEGRFLDVPAILQAPVLWGLERRLMPKMMRLGLAQLALRRAFASPWFQRRFANKHFQVPMTKAMFRAFFDGYARCAALPQLFEWLTPALLRDLGPKLKSDGAQWGSGPAPGPSAPCPAALDRITLFWGDRDHVVPPKERVWTEEALGVTFPIRTFPDWGHYPMIDDPEGWIREVTLVLEAALPV